MLAAYTNQNFGLSERVFGFIPTTNALMVIFMQMMVTRRASRLKPESAMVLGALFYAVSIFGIFFANGFWGFWLCMVGSTIGEMVLLPTTTTYTSRLAPPDMRARYMSLYTLTTGIGSGLGPLLGGIVADIFGARSMWFAAGMAALVGFFVFSLVALRQRRVEKMEPLTPKGEV
jgi:MFS family permease